MRFMLLGIAWLFSQQAWAFGNTGHQMVCELAYQQVTASTRAAIDKTVALSPYSDFVSACSWADDIKAQKQYRHTSVHHYVNMPWGETAVTMAMCPADGCILSAIAQMQQRLKNNAQDWQALLFLAHYIGDLHQPLHVSYKEDLGGNRAPLYLYELPTNLHLVWDFALLKHAGYEQTEKQRQLYKQLEPKQRQLWQQGAVLDWANESARLTGQLYQQFNPGMALTDSEVAQHTALLEQRLLQAGVRLAMLLDQWAGAN